MWGDILEELNNTNKIKNLLKVLVVGATGNQGGAVARKLLDKGHHVRALTRNKNSSKALKLKELGAEVVEGDVGDVYSLQEAMKGRDAVFALTTPFEKGINFEIKSGFLLEFAANTTGVSHFVFSSIASSHKNTGIPHFASKFQIEQHIKAVDTPYTIIKPVYFMENLLTPWMLSNLKKGVISIALPPDRKVQMINLEDFANLVVYVIENRDQYLKKTIEIASDEISGSEVAEILSKVIGVPIKYNELNYDEIATMGENFVKTFKWLKEIGYNIDILKLHGDISQIDWHDFEAWAKKQFVDFLGKPVKQKII